MTKFFFKFKKPIFGPFSQFWGQKRFFKKKLGCHAQLDKGFQHPGKIQRNLMITFQENTQTDVRREGWTDHISQDPSSQRQGLTSKTAVDWHLKAKNYCITVSMQKISSIHKLIQQILGSHELNDHVHFLQSPPKHH